MLKLVSSVLGLFGGGAAATVAGGAIDAVAITAAVTPAAIWFVHHKDETAVVFAFTWGQLAVAGLVVAAVLKLVHYVKSPGQ